MGAIRSKYGGHSPAPPAAVVESEPVAESLALVRQATAGDFEAFGKLYHRYVEPIYRYVFYQVRDKMIAEDITEEVFIKALKAIGSCQGREATFSSWLYRIARNQVIDNFRTTRKELPLEADLVTGLSDPKQELEKKVEQRELLNLIGNLPANQKQVILLKFIEGRDNEEISSIMGKSQGAIRILQLRALATLRSLLGKQP